VPAALAGKTWAEFSLRAAGRGRPSTPSVSGHRLHPDHAGLTRKHRHPLSLGIPQKTPQGTTALAGNRDLGSVLLREKTPAIIIPNTEAANIHPGETSSAGKTAFKLIRGYLPMNGNFVPSNASQALQALCILLRELLP